MVDIAPFLWSGNRPTSAADAARQRSIAQALFGQNSEIASNPWEGIAQIARAYTGSVLDGRASEAETAGREEVAALLAGLGTDSDLQSIMAVMGDEWASDAQRTIAQMLFGEQMRQAALADQRNYDAPLRDAQLQGAGLANERAAFELDQMRNPPPAAPIEVGGVLLDPTTYQPIFDSRTDTGFTLSPGQERFDGQGNAIASVPPETEPGFRPLTPEEASAYGIPAGTPAQINDVTGEVKGLGGVNVTTNVGGNEMTPGWEAIDKAFADTYLSWVGGGGADVDAQLQNLDNAMSLLESGQARTGNWQSMLPREAQAFLNSDGIIARENVEEVVQRSLRETLGAQFTEREGERLIQRAFNPLLPQEENMRRVRILTNKLREMAAAKSAMVEHFNQNGTLFGYQGQAPSMNSLLAVEAEFGADPVEGASSQPATRPDDVPADLWELLTPEERTLWQ